jgi:hypothetical protein
VLANAYLVAARGRVSDPELVNGSSGGAIATIFAQFGHLGRREPGACRAFIHADVSSDYVPATHLLGRCIISSRGAANWTNDNALSVPG